MRVLRFIILLLVIIGALNWGLYGFFQYDLVADLFGDMSKTSRILYGIIGIAGLLGIAGLVCTCRSCGCGSNCSCCVNKTKKK
ncbi:MAG TPA: DUF378 domain-containing protein [Chlamydiales bacterium]|nr:DUF378 domain-containing protein [Chlamydiales bacterium]